MPPWGWIERFHNMPRTRDLRPGFFKNENLGECQPLTRLLFAGLWTLADREGRLEDRPKKIKSELLPYDNCDANELLSELENFKFIQRYEVGGVRYIQITGFPTNQRVHPKEPPSVIPGPSHEKPRQIAASRGETIPNRTIPSFPSIPTLPPVSPPKGDKQKRAFRLPEDWEPEQKLLDWAKEKHPQVNTSFQTELFKNHFLANGKRMVDWNRTWMNWIARALDFSRPNPQVTQTLVTKTHNQLVLEAWKAGKSFIHKPSGKTVPPDALEPFNHHSQLVTDEKATAFRGKKTSNVAYFTEFEIVP